jgi:hypothetical protein
MAEVIQASNQQEAERRHTPEGINPSLLYFLWELV